MTPPSLPQRLRRLLANRRGASTLVFAGTAVTLLGAAALATEGTAWYAARRDAQAAADAAALSGAATLGDGVTLATANALRVAQLNGFTHNAVVRGNTTTVTVNMPPLSGSRTTDANAVEVIVSQPQQVGLASLVGAVGPLVRARAVAVLSSSDICALALTGGIRIGGTSEFTARNCAIGSNSTQTNAVRVDGNAELEAATVATRGTCPDCSDADRVTLSSAARENLATPIPNPFASVPRQTVPLRSAGGGCVEWDGSAANRPQPFQSNGGRVICAPGSASNMRTIGVQSVVNLAPGTYFFHNTSLSFTSSGGLSCTACDANGTGTGSAAGAGVTLVFTGATQSLVGSLKITATGTSLSLNAPRFADGSQDWSGVVVHRVGRAENGRVVNNDPIQMTGGTVDLRGGIYAPTTDLDIAGNGTTTCAVYVAAAITITGTATTTTTGCRNFGTRPPTVPGAGTAAAALVE